MQDQRAAVARESIRSQILQSFRTPIMWVGGAMDAFFSWTSSRQWIVISIVTPLMLILASPLAISLAIRLQHRDFLARQYVQIAESKLSPKRLEAESQKRFGPGLQTKLTAASGVSSMPVETGGPSGESLEAKPDPALAETLVIATRISHLTPKDPQALYRLALIHHSLGNTKLAKATMESIARAKSKSFPPANAWLAKQMLSEMPGDQYISNENLGYLTEFLEACKDWKGTDPKLLLILSQIHSRKNRNEDALEAAKLAAAIDPACHLQVARLAQRMGRKSEMDMSAELALKHFRAKLGQESGSPQDVLLAAQAMLLLGRNDEAIRMLQDGLANVKAASAVSPIRRLLSDLLVQKFQPTIQRDGDKWTAQLALIEAAAEADDTNPAISYQAAQLMEKRIRPSNNVIAILRRHLQEGTALAATHMIVGRTRLERNEVSSAISDFQAILKSDPKNSEALEWMGRALLKKNPPDLAAATESIKNALEFAGPSAGLFELLGDAHAAGKDWPKAFEQFEKSFRVDQQRKTNLEKLIAACEELGRKDLVKKYKQALTDLTESQFEP